MKFRPGASLEAKIPNLIRAWRGKPASPGGVSDVLSAAEIRSVGASLLRLQRGLTGDRCLIGESYMDDRGLLGAYLLYYWPVSYLQTSLALEELTGSADSPEARSFRRVLDIGSGPGPASAAFQDAGARDFMLVDSSEKALACARGLLASSGRSESISTVTADLENGFEAPAGPFDAIVLGHSVNELWKERPDRLALRLDFVRSLARRLAPDGILLLVEPALLSTSRELLELRDNLLSISLTSGDAGSSGMRLRVAGPCPGSWSCPAFAAGPQRTCHAESPWNPPEPVASLARGAGLDRESIKSTWIALMAEPAGFPQPDKTIGRDSGRLSGRIVSDPMLNKAGRIRYIVCSGGDLVTVSAGRTDRNALSAGFFGLRRGDTVEFGGLATRGETAANRRGLSLMVINFGFVDASVLRVASKAPSP